MSRKLAHPKRRRDSSCRFVASAGSTFCLLCRCRVGDCVGQASEVTGTCRKWAHIWAPYPAPLRSVLVFAESLVNMEPMDLERFLEHGKGVNDIVLLSLLADVWEPTACTILADEFRRLPPRYSTEEVASAFQRCADRLCCGLAVDDTDSVADAREVDLSVLKISGMARHFGFQSLCKRLLLWDTFQSPAQAVATSGGSQSSLESPRPWAVARESLPPNLTSSGTWWHPIKALGNPHGERRSLPPKTATRRT